MIHLYDNFIYPVAKSFCHRTANRECLIFLISIDVDISTRQTSITISFYIGVLEHDGDHFGAGNHRLLGRSLYKFDGRHQGFLLHHNIARHFHIRINTCYSNRVGPCRIRKTFSNPAKERIGFCRRIKVSLNALRKVKRLSSLDVCILVDNWLYGIACRHCLRGIVTNERKHRHNKLMRHDNLYRGRRIVIDASHIYRHNVFFILQ